MSAAGALKENTVRVCAACRQPINGSYVTALGADWHPEHFCCAGCGVRLDGSYVPHEGRPYHQQCYREAFAPRCAACRRSISGSYVTAFDATWHPEHFCCAACGLALAGQYVTHRGRPYHQQCYREAFAPRCALCRRPVGARYLQDSWQNAYCAEHQHTTAPCRFCGRLVPHAETPADDRPRCQVCRSTAVERRDQAQQLLGGLVRWFGREGLRFKNLSLSVDLQSPAVIQRELGASSGRLGFARITYLERDGRRIKSTPTEVVVLRGMPQTLYAGVVVHELGHIWLAVHQVMDLPEWAEEGFCELLAHRYWSQLGTPVAEYHRRTVEENRDPVYGEGYRRVAALVQQHGFARVIALLQAEQRLPAAGWRSWFGLRD